MNAVTLFAFVFLTGSALADQWNPPEPQAYACPSGRFILRVIPGSSEEKKNATAVIFELNKGGDRYEKRREFPLLNSSSPVDACISDTAEVATFDDWGRMGYDLAVVWYSPEGKRKREYTLDELLPDKPRVEIKEHHSSKSSVWWRKDSGHFGAPLPYFNGTSLVINDAVGGYVVLTLGSKGSIDYHPAEENAK